MQQLLNVEGLRRVLGAVAMAVVAVAAVPSSEPAESRICVGAMRTTACVPPG